VSVQSVVWRAALLVLVPLCGFAREEPLGAGMEGFVYPHPVHMLDLRMEGEPVRMAYMDVPPEGQANGGTVVLLHGRNFFGAYWQDTIDVLRRAGYRVVVPDQIGFGKSSKPDVPHSLHLHAQNTRRLLASLNIERATLIAHSLGGMMAVRFALMYPEMTQRLVLEAPIGLEDYRTAVPYATREELTAEALAQTREGIDRFFRGFFARWQPQFQQYADVQHRWLLGPEAYRIARTAASTYLMAYEQPVVYELSQVRAPTLLIAGDRDRAAIGRNRVPPELRDRLGRVDELAPKAAAALPDGRLIMLQGVGHIPHLEAPERFHDEVMRFLGQ
jgi:pimeloyl-ACP methyl ester carboxylesterase